MRYEVSKDQSAASAWCVEVVDQDGSAYSAYFVGPQAEQRAQAFADRKNHSMAALHQRAA